MRAVFVHLGKSNPRHLWLNLTRHMELFPDVPISVVLSHSAHEKRIPVGAEIIRYSQSRETGQLLGGLAARAGFRGGFWLLTLERLIALEQAHIVHKDQPMLHIESDVLLMPNFPWIEMAQQKTLMWGQISDNEDIGALLFSPTSAITSTLVELISKEAIKNPSTSDMRSLRTVAAHLSSEEFKYFPLGLDNSEISDGIFDVGSIGMWLCGQDERNSWGQRKFFQTLPHHLVKPDRYKYEVRENELWIHSSNQELKLFSLHVHSKDLKLFGRNSRARLEELVRRSEAQFPKSEFFLLGFVSKLKETLSEILSLEGLHAIKKKLLGFINL